MNIKNKIKYITNLLGDEFIFDNNEGKYRKWNILTVKNNSLFANMLSLKLKDDDLEDGSAVIGAVVTAHLVDITDFEKEKIYKIIKRNQKIIDVSIYIEQFLKDKINKGI